MDAQIPNAKLTVMFYRFLEFVRFRDGDRPLDFVDENTFLGGEENYKYDNAVLARRKLDYNKWDDSWIGTGKILERCKEAMDCAGNLVYRNQKIWFKNMIDPANENFRPHAERVLYDIYKSTTEEQEEAAFSQARRTFGGNYETLAYLFFVKNPSKFLPISPDNFEKSLSAVGVDYPLSRRCSWQNYNGFIQIVKDIQEMMREELAGVDVRLIDAHTFLWVINEEVFQQWDAHADKAEVETAAENHLNAQATGNAKKVSRLTSCYTRSADVVKRTKARANGVCQLCGKPAPFMDKHGDPYLETHHIVWLSRGGEDSTSNTVALCPNCHTKMHIVDAPADVKALLSTIK